MLKTTNGLHVGDKILYETIEDPATGKTHFIPGTVKTIVSRDSLVFVSDTGRNEALTVSAEWCIPHTDEENVETVVPAHQAGNEIIDERTIPPVQESFDFTGSSNKDR